MLGLVMDILVVLVGDKEALLFYLVGMEVRMAVMVGREEEMVGLVDRVAV